MSADELMAYAPYALARAEKRVLMNRELKALCLRHREGCPEYAALLNAFGSIPEEAAEFEALPYLPVRLFKEYELKSVPDTELYRTMTSSGTTGQRVSKIFLDRETAVMQSKALTKIVGDFLGQKRLPMIVLDTSAVVKNRAMFSARGAGILGFSMFARDTFYALDENMCLDEKGLRAFLDAHAGERLFLFGFTYMIWQAFLSELHRVGWKPDLSAGVLIHGGGWKKLESLRISSEQFRDALSETCGLEHVHNYYGMVEQTGAIYMECEAGHLHAPIWSDVTFRRARDFSVAEAGEAGLTQVSSLLARSYPGHNLLTEDEGRLLGEDDCPCGRKGKYFEIIGRIGRAEVRGCSDTYEQPAG